MTRALNTLFVLTQGAYLRRDQSNFVVQVEGKETLRVPVHHLGDVSVHGRVVVSPGALELCAEQGVALSFHTQAGRFIGRLRLPTSGNVLLRLAQYQAAQTTVTTLNIARNCVAGKVQNARNLLLRAARDAGSAEDAQALRAAAGFLGNILRQLPHHNSLDAIRGAEGGAARAYFGAFTHMVKANRETFRLDTRNRRPPRDPANALLSFLYALLTKDCAAACEGVGLDPQLGFLHALRPGRPALALDLVEELRPVLADRLALALINRQQVKPAGFRERGGAVQMDDQTRKTVIVAYQERKRDDVQHPILQSSVPLGLVPHIQARLLARTLRGDLDGYPPFLYR